MNVEETIYFKKLKRIINRNNNPLSSKLAKILSYVAEDIGIDQNKYFIIGPYALKDYTKYRDLSTMQVNMESSEFNKLAYFGLGNFIKSDKAWILDLTYFYNNVNEDEVNKFYIEIFKMSPSQARSNNNYSFESLKLCGLQVDNYGNNYLTINSFYEMSKLNNNQYDKSIIKFIEKNNILGNEDGNENKEINQCGGDLNYYYKYLKYKKKYLQLKNLDV